ncbi:hypothetical protein BOX15_Mlig014309g1 [Macrostomum lignano]|uniref:Uncharacterized protein n=2 Tax=Macrostomum lignano TaxID=282301 RepID=A0A267FM78_9PLAT|nr:hypothetical protein BOX15_Mlig009605g1 [Macrostomum lignano]PAA74881.1 hypothetical protein BOX15_Mlig014309g1 [Macrostomum lignano]
MDKLKKVLSGDDEEAETRSGIFSDINEGATFSWSTRIKGFLICFSIGWAFSLLGSFFLAIPGRGVIIFGIFYTFGNILSLTSTCFLMGPLNQLKKMFAPTRLIATLLMLLFMTLALLSALLWNNVALTVLFCILEFLALTWYSISYIPYARTAIKNAVSACVG